MRIAFVLISFIILSGCSNSNEAEHSFFVAGHTYGDPRLKGENKGLYRPFKEKIQFINEQKSLKQGFLLGDVVWGPKWWDDVQADLDDFDCTLHIIRGNHDGPLKPFEKKFGKSYKSFVEDNNLFIVLDSNLDNWNISGDQLTFLMNSLRNEGESVNNVFILVHHLIWWAEDKLPKPKPNSTAKRDAITNFWDTIEPLLRIQDKPVYILAGDAGAFSKEYRKRDHIIEYFYYNYDNLTFVATGMGGGVRDNFVIVDIFNDGSVEFRLVHLNGDDINGLGKLEDYKLPK